MAAAPCAEERETNFDNGNRKQGHVHLDQAERGGDLLVQDDRHYLLLDGPEKVSVRHAGV